MILSLLLLTQEPMTLDRLAKLIALSFISVDVLLGVVLFAVLRAIEELKKGAGK